MLQDEEEAGHAMLVLFNGLHDCVNVNSTCSNFCPSNFRRLYHVYNKMYFKYVYYFFL